MQLLLIWEFSQSLMISSNDLKKVKQLADLLLKSKYSIAFTGAGMSVASGIPPFRGENGIWSKYNPQILELSYYYSQPARCWKFIKEIFYDKFQGVKPNRGHYALAKLQEMGFIKNIFTQNIDNLHQDAGSNRVFEFHGNTKYFKCHKCNKSYPLYQINLADNYPKCPECQSLLKPDFIFFSEELPHQVLEKAYSDSEIADVILVIGCSGEVYPANQIPYYVHKMGGKVVEINPQSSLYSSSITDISIQAKSQDILDYLVKFLKEMKGQNYEK